MAAAKANKNKRFVSADCLVDDYIRLQDNKKTINNTQLNVLLQKRFFDGNNELQ